MTEPTDEGTTVEIETTAATCPAPCEQRGHDHVAFWVFRFRGDGAGAAPWGRVGEAATPGSCVGFQGRKVESSPRLEQSLSPEASGGCCCPHQQERISSRQVLVGRARRQGWPPHSAPAGRGPVCPVTMRLPSPAPRPPRAGEALSQREPSPGPSSPSCPSPCPSSVCLCACPCPRVPRTVPVGVWPRTNPPVFFLPRPAPPPSDLAVFQDRLRMLTVGGTDTPPLLAGAEGAPDRTCGFPSMHWGKSARLRHVLRRLIVWGHVFLLPFSY